MNEPLKAATSLHNNELFDFGDFHLNLRERTLTKKGERLSLAEKPFDLLAALVRRGNCLITKDELLKQVWPDAIVEENNLDKNISLLRKVFRGKPGDADFIETVRGHGYRFVADITVVEPVSNSPLARRYGREVPYPVPGQRLNVVAPAQWRSSEREAPTLEAESVGAPAIPHIESVDGGTTALARNGRPKLTVTVLLLLILGSAAIASYLAFRGRSSHSASAAVLPFKDLTKDKNGEYLSDGITESLINDLSRLPGMKVMSRNSTFLFRDDQSDTRAIGAKLGVEKIITGDIQQMGDKLVVNVRLIDPSDGSQIWGEQYVETSADLIAIQSKIASDVARKFGGQPDGAKTTRNDEAYQNYLKGRYIAERAGDPLKAISYFEKAAELDPSFAAPHADIAGNYAALWTDKRFPRLENILKAHQHALKALELDERLPAAHEVYGYLLFNFDHNYAAAEKELKRALELDPNNASARETFSGMLSALGRHSEALSEIQRADQLDPLSPSIKGSYGFGLLASGRLDDAIEQFNASLELDPKHGQGHYGLAVAYQLLHRYQESIDERAKMAELAGDIRGAEFIKKSFARGGWEGFLRAATEEPQAPAASSLIKATFYAELGNHDKAFEILNAMCDDGSPSILRINVDQRFESLRADPRFAQLIGRINLE